MGRDYKIEPCPHCGSKNTTSEFRLSEKEGFAAPSFDHFYKCHHCQKEFKK